MESTLQYQSFLDASDLLATEVHKCLLTQLESTPDEEFVVAEIDPHLADTAEFCERYDFPLADSANCVIIAGKRGEETRVAACVALATTRVDVNGFVRRYLNARRASFMPMEDAVRLTNMEFGGITPFGLPSDWSILVDSRVVERPQVVVGSGVRKSKLFVAGRTISKLPNANVVDGLAS